MSRSISDSDTEAVCFGMIACEAQPCGERVDPKCLLPGVPATLSGDQIWSQNRIVAYLQQRNGHILRQLSCQPGMAIQLHCSATVSVKGLKHSCRDLKLFANVYGPRSLSTEVGDFLERCEVYLQDPKSCDRNVPYVNPHHLVDPDAEIQWTQHLSTQSPRLEDFITSSDLLADLTSKDALPEANVPSVLQTELFRQATPTNYSFSWYRVRTDVR